MVERAEVEHLAKEWPTIGNVGDEDRDTGFADVPECPLR